MRKFQCNCGWCWGFLASLHVTAITSQIYNQAMGARPGKQENSFDMAGFHSAEVRAVPFRPESYTLRLLSGAAYNQKTFPLERRTSFLSSQGPDYPSAPNHRCLRRQAA